MKYLVLMIGVPGSGKSTFMETFYPPSQGVARVNPDSIRAELCGDPNNQTVSKEAWKIAYIRLETYLALDEVRTVVFDAVLINPRTRAELVSMAKKYNAQVVYTIMATPVDEAIKRNEFRERKVPTNIIKDFDKRLGIEFPALKKDRGEIND